MDFFVLLILLGFANAHAMSIKRSEKANVESVDESAYKVNYDVYPVRWENVSKKIVETGKRKLCAGKFNKT
jgi:hypothetical protein